MVTRKNVLHNVGKKFKSIGTASPAKVATYAGRAATNVAKGSLAMVRAGEALSTGDVKGAAVYGHQAANNVIGKKNIKAASNVIIGKKATQGVSKGVRILNRADKAVGQYESGDVTGAAKTAMGKKAYDKTQSAPSADSAMSHHIARAKHHSEQAQALHTAVTGMTPAPIGGGSMRPR